MPPATNSATKHAAAPERSLLQRMDALQRANEIRTRRAQLKRDLKAGRVSIQTLLTSPPEYVETAKGGRVDIVTSDPAALAAVHQFLKFQIAEHKTGDPLTAR